MGFGLGRVFAFFHLGLYPVARFAVISVHKNNSLTEWVRFFVEITHCILNETTDIRNTVASV
jgi:hypothetical protein